MFTLKRISTVPASPLRVLVDAPQGDTKEAGLAAGGSFYFYPAGSEDGETSFGMSEHAARTVMEDPGLAIHFECSPALPAVQPPAEDVTPAAPQGRRRVRQDQEATGTQAGE